MTRRERNDGCHRLRALHAYCKRRFNKASGKWVCVKCVAHKEKA